MKPFTPAKTPQNLCFVVNDTSLKALPAPSSRDPITLNIQPEEASHLRKESHGATSALDACTAASAHCPRRESDGRMGSRSAEPAVQASQHEAGSEIRLFEGTAFISKAPTT
ncbi:hypothetical protein HKW77_02460 [Pseudomonas aeruginosa]|nr:hypothetical protein [Pseudomonas aeruginosa]MBF3321907.1 hypothetical protein [Pseudomonas aeruginosa]